MKIKKIISVFITSVLVTILSMSSFNHNVQAKMDKVIQLSKFDASTVNVEYDIKTPRYSEGSNERIGYTISDMVSKVNDNKSTVHTVLYIVEDVYDINDNYKTTRVIYSAYHKNKKSGKTLEKEVIKEVTKDKVPSGKFNVEKFVNDTNQPNSKPFKEGTDNYEADLNNQKSPDSLLSISSTVDSSGAYDNYYNKYSDNTFRVQALGAAQGYYLRYDASLSSDLNRQSYQRFKNLIDNYEQAVIVNMNYNTLPDDVSNWAGNISIFTTIGTYGGKILKGPTGWVKGSNYLSYSHMFTQLVRFTSEAYANGTRLSASFYAAEYLSDASTMLTYGGANFENYEYSSVKGYGYYGF